MPARVEMASGKVDTAKEPLEPLGAKEVVVEDIDSSVGTATQLN